MKALNMIKLCVVLMVTTLLLSTDAYASAKSVKIQTNITCGACKDKIEAGLKDVKGINKTDVDVASKIVTVSYDDDSITESSITKTISGLGYSAEVVTTGTKVKASNGKEGCAPKKGCCSSKKSGQKKSYDKKSCGSKHKNVK